jgi:hypothetical protein
MHQVSYHHLVCIEASTLGIILNVNDIVNLVKFFLISYQSDRFDGFIKVFFFVIIVVAFNVFYDVVF